MTNITVALSDERMGRLRELAIRLQITPEELIQLSVDELLTGTDDRFKKVTEYVLAKNAELYKRLA